MANVSTHSPTNSIHNYVTEAGALDQADQPESNDVEEHLSSDSVLREKLELSNDSNNNNVYSLGNNNNNSSNSDSASVNGKTVEDSLSYGTAISSATPLVDNNNNTSTIVSNPPVLSTLGISIPNSTTTLSYSSTTSNHASHVPLPNTASLYHHQPSTHLLPNPQMYPDPAYLAKEAAQKNYAMKLAAASHSLSGKPLTAMGYPPHLTAAQNSLQQQHLAALSKQGISMGQPQSQQNMAHFAAAFAQYQHMQHQASHAAAASNSGTASPQMAHHRLPSPYGSAQNVNSLLAQQHSAHQAAVAHSQAQSVAQMYSGLTRPPPPIFVQAQQHMMRPQMGAAHNPYAAAAAGNAQFFPGNIFYPGAGYAPQLGMSPAGLTSPIAAATAGNSTAYSSGLHTANFQAIQAVQQAHQAGGTATAGSAVVLNPYKKMKTS